jgi:hypothetical protein
MLFERIIFLAMIFTRLFQARVGGIQPEEISRAKETGGSIAKRIVSY